MTDEFEVAPAPAAQPALAPNTFRVTLKLTTAKPRLDQVLIEALRNQARNLELKSISRTEFKKLFAKKHVRIKGQPALPSSSLAAGTTYVDITGYVETYPV